MQTLTLMGMASMAFVVWFTHRQYTAADQGKGQTKASAIIEAWMNIAIGFSVNFVANFWLIPLMTGVDLPHSANFWGGWVYTTISIVRQYAIRRWFNARLHTIAQRVSTLTR